MEGAKKEPVSIDGIEFDALIEEEKDLKASIPTYPVEDGFPVSDTIILDPITIKMTLFISRTPVTWLQRHGTDMTRVQKVCEQLEKLWQAKKLVKIVTQDITYTDMGITDMSFRKSKDLGYDKEVSISAQKVVYTTKATAEIPDDVMKSGETEANAGTASVSDTGEGIYDESLANDGGSTSSGSNNSDGSESKKSSSILYGMFGGMFD